MVDDLWFELDRWFFDDDWARQLCKQPAVASVIPARPVQMKAALMPAV
jgi:hypothetical protein